LIRVIQEAPLVDEATLPIPRPLTKRKLSVREIEVALFVSHGANQPQIAEHLGISVETVKTHMKRVKRKLGAKNTPHMVRRIFEEGYIE